MFWSQEPFVLSVNELSGVDNMQPYIGVPSCGLRKRTPSSVTFASLSKLTIWNLIQVESNSESFITSSFLRLIQRIEETTHPPLSVKMLPFQPCKACAPPTFSIVSCPGFRPR